MRLYLGGKMVGVAGFGFAAFDEAAGVLRSLEAVTEVFNPAERDRAAGFEAAGLGGTLAELDQAGFSRRSALGADWAWIAGRSDGMVVLDNWPDSPGTISEIACHQALYLPVWEYKVFLAHWYNGTLREHALPKLLEM